MGVSTSCIKALGKARAPLLPIPSNREIIPRTRGATSRKVETDLARFLYHAPKLHDHLAPLEGEVVDRIRGLAEMLHHPDGSRPRSRATEIVTITKQIWRSADMVSLPFCVSASR